MPAEKQLSKFLGQAYSGPYSGQIHFDAIMNKKIYRIGYCNNEEIGQYVQRFKSRKEDRYVSANSFYANLSKTENIFAIHNIVFDIDCHNGALSIDAINELIDKFLFRFERDLVSQNEIPDPSMICRTGRGVQLWYNLEQCSRALLFIYRCVSSALTEKIRGLLSEYPEELSGLELDGTASGRAAGIYRYPGSWNTKVQSYGTYEIRGNKYKLPDLLDRYVPAEKTEKVAPMFFGKDLTKDSYFLAHMRRMELVESLIRDRDKVVGEETRDIMLFIYYNAAVQVMSRVGARQKLITLNQRFKEPMREYKYIIDYIDNKEFLRLKNSTLITWLSLTAQEQEKYCIFVGESGVKPLQNATRDKKRQIAKNDRNYQIMDLAKQGKTIKEIAELACCHRNTVSKVLNHKESRRQTKGELILQISKMKKKKMTQKQIAETLDVPLITVRRLW